MAAGSDAATVTDREIRITRLLDAPREVVWKAWTDRDQVALWFGPSGFTTTVLEMDVRVGGVWRFIMHGPDGVDYSNKVVYEEIIEPERLVYMHGTDDDDDAPRRFQATITFAEEDGKTRLTLRTLFPSAAEREFAVKEIGAIEGGTQTLDRLAAYLAK